ncbi:hypothetical protein SISNIDRAFT_394151, partial [Sistotremastrum niveocremeum HHB9708]
MAYHPQPADVVSGEQYRYALQNFRIAHEKVEEQRRQLEEQERHVAQLRARITLLEGGDDQQKGQQKGGQSVDDFSIKVAASNLEKQINRWAAEVVRTHPGSLDYIRGAILDDISDDTSGIKDVPTTALQVQNLLRHAIAETISEAIINCLIITNSNETNAQLTRIHEFLFAKDPTVAFVWRRQTFVAAIETCSPEMTIQLLQETMPTLLDFFTEGGQTGPPAPLVAIINAAYTFSRMLHGSRSSSAGSNDAFYRAFVPELGSILDATQVELSKRCIRSERGEIDRVGSTIFPGLVKVTRPTPGAHMKKGEVVQTTVRRSQVICECAMGIGG